MKRPHWLIYLGGRRPVDLADRADFDEITHDKTTPAAGNLPPHVEGHSLGGGHRHGGKHRA